MANTYDAIVVGSGITGGWAAKELSEKGLKTLVLERGKKLDHVADYPHNNTAPFQFEFRGQVTPEVKKDYPVQSKVYAFNAGTKDYWVKDTEHPYTTPDDKPFSWIRGYHVGGRSLMWGRQVYRWSDLDFSANQKDGHGVDWPIRYADIAPWYDYVENYIGVSGQKEGLPQLPDGQFLPPMEMNAVEKHVKQSIEGKWSDRNMTIGRAANLTQNHNGRSACQHRNLCYRGCPFSAYFSSQSSTLPAAAKTGNMTLRPNSVVESVIYDDKTNRASGVRVIDAVTGETTEYFAKVVFLCASTLGSTWILLNSKNGQFENGMANSSGALGKYLMDHHYRLGARANIDGFDDRYYFGGRPNGIYVPRFRNVNEQRKDYLRGFGFQGSASRAGWERGNWNGEFGADFKNKLHQPGDWSMNLLGFGECLPYAENNVRLNPEVKDVHGLPTLFIDGKFRENEDRMREDIKATAAEMLEAAGAKDIQVYDQKEDYVLGGGIHEMGTARMGRDPKTSVLNKWNQTHDIPNLFVTDGACMTSASCVNPSLTYMALTARAVNYAVEQLKKGNL
ncbi:MAG: GMC oxidoreductase [Saprospiraceae bacterium]